MGMQNGTATSEGSLSVSYKTEHILGIWFSRFAPWLFTWMNWKCTFMQNLHRDVYSNFLHNCPNVEATKMSFSRWADTLWYSGILFSVKRKWALTLWKFTEELNVYYQVEEANLKWQCLWVSGKGKTMETVKKKKKAKWLPEVKEDRRND